MFSIFFDYTRSKGQVNSYKSSEGFFFFFSSKILPGHDSRKEQKLKKTIPINFADIKLSKSKKKKKKMETLNKQGTTTALTSQTLLIENIYWKYFIFSPVLNSFPPPEP